MIIAVDFDGTLCIDEYPSIGKPNTRLIKSLKSHIEHGHRVILWTCRTGAALDDAVAWCKTFGLYFDAVNENLPHIKESWGGDTRKVYADIYIDDKNRLVPW